MALRKTPVHPLIRLRAALGFLTLLVLPAAYASAPLPNQVTLVPDASVAGNPVNAPQAFTVTATGSYTVTLTDLQEPKPLTALTVVIASATARVTTLTLPASSASVTLAPGTYFAQVIATAASGSLGGTFSVVVTPAAGGTDVLSYHDVVAPPNPGVTSGESVLQQKFTVTAVGNYTLTATDQQFPVALSAAPTILVLTDCGSPPAQGCSVTEPFIGPGTAMLQPGTYDLFSFAQATQVSAGGAYAGLYSISIAGNGMPATAYAATVPVGQLPAATNFSIPAAGIPGTVSVALKDVATNGALTLVKPLASIKAIVTEGPNVLLPTVTGASGASPYAFSPSVAGTAQLYVAATANAMTGQSGWAAYVTEDVNGVTMTLADIAEPVVDGTHFGYAFQTPALTTNPYTLAVHDFVFPNAITAQESLVIQQGALLASIHASNPVSVDLPFTPTVAGVVNLLVFPVPASSTSNGLLGLAVEPGSGPNAYQVTQAVGALFNPISLSVPAAGTYGVTLTDLGFPAAFSSLSVLGTQGNAPVGQVTIGGAGGNTFTFSAPAAGSYVLNVLAQDGAMVHYGLYGLEVGVVPTVSLSAAAMSVTSGQHVMLTWSSTNATGCTASGGWTGAEPTSGTAFDAGTITQDTSYTLVCTGAGGPSAPQTITVTYSASSSSSSGGGSGSGSKSGGGAVTPEWLLALGVLAGLKLRRRRAMLPGYGPRA